MPTYVYRREDGTTFETFQRMSDEALKTCPTTGQSVTRVIGGGAGLIFKGSGFYGTDYVKKTGTPDKTEATPSTSADAPAKDKGADSKPASSE